MIKKISYSLIIFSFSICNTYSYDALENYFQQHLKNKKICLVLNPGNAGDALIWYGTYCLFKKLGVQYIISNEEKDILSSNIDAVVYGGGGNFVSYYKYAAQFIEKYMYKVKKLIILPQTIQGHEKLLKKLSSSVVIFPREYMSYQHCKKNVPYAYNVYYANDMAFYADLSDFYANFDNSDYKPSSDLFAFRMDAEKNSARKEVTLPKSNVDISKLGTHRPGDSVQKCMKTSFDFLARIMPYETIWTDRLHIGIAAFMLGKKVHLFDNSYGKNEAVYKASIEPFDDLNQVVFHGKNFKALQLKLNELKS